MESKELSLVTRTTGIPVRTLKPMPKRKNRIFKSYKIHRYREEDRISL